MCSSLLILLFLLPLFSSTYTFFEFVRQWSPNTCYQASHKCKFLPPNINTWTIRGLWPNTTASPSECENLQCDFYSESVADLAEELHEKWPSNYKGKDTRFWGDEYCKHGMCARDTLWSQHLYFAKALSLHSELDLETALTSVGIVPDWHRTYSMRRLEHGIRKVFRVNRASYWCRFVRDNGKTKQLMYQISLCLDKSFRVRECPVMSGHSCDKEQEFYLLPFDMFNTLGNIHEVVHEEGWPYE